MLNRRIPHRVQIGPILLLEQIYQAFFSIKIEILETGQKNYTLIEK
jgi:hypothetical protein